MTTPETPAMTTSDRTAPVSPRRGPTAQLLRLDSWEARAIVALFVITNALFAIGTADVTTHPWMSYLAVIVVGLGGVMVVGRHPHPQPWSDTSLVLLAVVSSSALVFGALCEPGNLGRATWHLGSNTWLLFFLAMRGRAGAAWLGMAALMAMTIAWGVSTERGAVSSALMMNSHIGILIIGTLFARLLTSTAARIAMLRERAVASSAEAAAAAAGLEIRRARVAELAQLATPLLERIAQGGDFTDDERAQFARAEARLRDSVRGRALALPDVVEAVEEARMRGVSVTILDDRGEAVMDGEAWQRMVAVIIDTLNQATGGSVTVRLLPAGRDTALTIRRAHGETITRSALDVHGHPVEP